MKINPPGQFTHAPGFPVYVVRFASEDKVVLAGGGGPGNSGIRNKVTKLKIRPGQERLEEVATFELDQGEDTPMSLALHPALSNVWVCGANRKVEDLKHGGKGEGEKKEEGQGEEVDEVYSISTLSSKDADDYQRVAQISPDGRWLLTGSASGKVCLRSFPNLEEPFPNLDTGIQSDIMDVDFDRRAGKFIAVQERQITIWDLQSGTVVDTLDSPMVNGDQPGSFRHCRFGRGKTFGYAFAVVNTKDRKGAFVCKVSATTFGKVLIRSVHNKPITAFSISEKGDRLAYGTADLGVGILDTDTLDVSEGEGIMD
ncbi:quinon protein alcohol dehydrogenase-like superfamily [Piptocephalis cylindrospora]|uniref:Quinon protein alcohol dehydrogenase-like superfamily n=1 Tax=Piptocephalis cylindrospora TaxID=1907219 RepID=A0A4P9Y797_9FUNG|nr:quinon protein alcohol dehydrogenase-like superfamily [Piptocephalis cylindrospora]|eukprot:RKP14986.1 quinon protein alcohol dehydrogenase-like superfamily [Piptocephalis cylindrospora]